MKKTPQSQMDEKKRETIFKQGLDIARLLGRAETGYRNYCDDSPDLTKYENRASDLEVTWVGPFNRPPFGNRVIIRSGGNDVFWADKSGDQGAEIKVSKYVAGSWEQELDKLYSLASAPQIKNKSPRPRGPF